ncbi:MAG: hypothetical protein B6D44_04320 [Ignavibacteriales bacterium UTCHB2]|jgi:tetratricopeptide (TPR) repeat protein|nr:MAG: hypothetical protein B6D44_04320 [Ignavibacteriales bacterium UTCHB2]
MKTLIIKTFFVLFILSNISYSQDWIKDYPGIPIETGLHKDWISDNPLQVRLMKQAGVDFVSMGITDQWVIDSLKNIGFKLLSVEAFNDNWVQYYTDAKYSVWEADAPSGHGDAKLFHNSSKCSIVNNSYLRLNNSAANDTCKMIWGPYYNQDMYYYTKSLNGTYDSVLYRVDFQLMLESIGPDTANQETPLCIIQAFHSNAVTTDSLGCTDTLTSRIIKRKDFTFLNQFSKYTAPDYTLLHSDCDNSLSSTFDQPLNQFGASLNSKSSGIPKVSGRQYIEYRVFWLGHPSYVLSVDSIIVSDLRAREIFGKDSTIYRQNIIKQANAYKSEFTDSVYGWLGFDEPASIDLYEPIRIVRNILDNASTPAQRRSLWIPWRAFWDGAYESRNNKFGAMKLIPWEEFGKRVGRVNVIQNSYLFDLPCNDSAAIWFPSVCSGDWRNTNIWRHSTLMYKPAYELDPYFGVSIQCGEVDPPYKNSYQRDIRSHEFLYTANLALMHGAKFLSLYTYFAQASYNNDTTIYTKRAIVQYPSVITDVELTDKYYTLKDTLSPRLKGSFGKTLKKLTPTEQFLNIDASNSYNFISHFSGNLECLPSTSDYDLGFFTDSLSRDYFMIISRYYNYSGSCPIFINLDESCLYNNLILTKYVADTTYNILRNDPIRVNLTRGDAELYRIYPVVRWGGSLLANDTINAGETLYDDMTIESGATLTVNGTYYAKANITVKNGGKIVAGENAIIHFESGNRLIIDGTAEIKGTSTNRLLISFLRHGIIIKPGSAFTMDYCYVISNGYAITTESGPQSYVNISNSNITAMSAGISLVASSSYEGFQTPPVPVIQNCIIIAPTYGICVSNYRSVLLKSNTFANCGISVSNVASAYIQDNDISLGARQNYSGIVFNNSGGYIRNNTIKNRANGIHLANSSPDIGGNLIENNYLHGLYIADNSFPNLIGQLQTNPPAYYPLAGYNRIRNNGNNTQPNSANDGSEIYFSYSDARLGTLKRPGCNEISDDRTATSTMETIWLISGNYGNEPHFLDAIYNYWGTTTPSSNRFGIATNFTPYNNTFAYLMSGNSTTETLVLKTSSGEIVDSISASECVPENISELEEIYSEANLFFAAGNIIEAKSICEQIVQGNYTTEEKLIAYNRLYTIGNLTSEDETYFTSLQSTFENNANSSADTLIKKIYNQNAINCDVSKGEYITAINKFDNIIQQNPNSEAAVYAEIDILTTALNLDTTNTQLGKISGGKYLVKGTSGYLSRLDEILQSRFGVNSGESEKIIPKEYSLEQNYPNPFNPITTIRYDLPKDGLVQLEVFDIIGRKITTLVNTHQSAGRYEINFDASNLASGVYIYKLQSGQYVSSKKMMLLK